MKNQTEQKYTIEWVPLDLMKVRWGISQRYPDAARIAKLANEFEIDAMGMPRVNHAGGHYWIVDGQTRVEAFKLWLREWSGQKIKCFVHHDLCEREEADLFLRLNDVKGVRTFDKYVISLTAAREEETNADAIVRKRGLKIAKAKAEGAIACVAMVMRIYRRGEDVLDRTLEISYAAFGDEGLEADLLDGLSQVIGRFEDQIKSSQAIHALRAVKGGGNAIRSRATRLRHATGSGIGACIAAATVEALNRQRSKKLPTWWKSGQGAGE